MENDQLINILFGEIASCSAIWVGNCGILWSWFLYVKVWLKISWCGLSGCGEPWWSRRLHIHIQMALGRILKVRVATSTCKDLALNSSSGSCRSFIKSRILNWDVLLGCTLSRINIGWNTRANMALFVYYLVHNEIALSAEAHCLEVASTARQAWYAATSIPTPITSC